MIPPHLLAATAALFIAGSPAQKHHKIVFIAGRPSHPTMMHEYKAGCALLRKCFDSVQGVETALYTNGWPSDPHALDGLGASDAIMLFMDGGDGHAAIQGDHLAQLAELMKKGVGLGCVHYAVELPKDKGGKEFQDWIGGYYETYWSCNPMWEPDYQTFPKHPITRGVKPFKVKDEWYMHMRFKPGMQGVTPILVAKPSDQVRKGPYVSPQGPYDHIVAGTGQDEIMMWCTQRPDGGRGFGFTGAHYHLNWANENFRKIVLNALVWIAHGDVPKNGIESTVTPEDLYANLDDKPGKPSGPPSKGQ